MPYSEDIVKSTKTQIVQGSRVLGVNRKGKPRVHTNSTTIRRCEDPSCSIPLSMYNKGPYCYTHSPRKQPRVRGRK